MRLGFHLSISGGLTRAIEQGVRTGCEAAQIFSRNPRSWVGKPLAPEDAAAFRRARAEAGLEPLAVHLPYLPNLAAPDDRLFNRSVRVLNEEMKRAELLGADFVVTHPGHVRPGQIRARALERVAQGVSLALAGLETPFPVTLLLENTSSQRGELGVNFEELARMLDYIEVAGRGAFRLGVCLDTAHAWAAGYDLARPDGQDKTLNEFDRILGLERLGLVHFNDSLAELGARRDRHAAVGRGRIGARGLARFLRRPSLSHLAAIMETPRATEADDLANMARAKRWRRQKTVETLVVCKSRCS